MATTKRLKPHSSARKKTGTSAATSIRAKKAASKRSQAATKSKKPAKLKERPAWLKKRDELTLKIFQWAYESNQRGEFHRL